VTTRPPVASRLRIATRKSQLALWQAEHVASLLRAAHPGIEIELVPLVTQGDRIQDRSLAAIGGKGLLSRNSKSPSRNYAPTLPCIR